MNESNSVATIDRTSLTDQIKFRLNEISKIENHFIQEIKERKLNNKILNKYVALFDYIDKILLVISATSGGVSIISFTIVIRAPVAIASESFTLIFSLTIRIIKKLLSITRNKKKKHVKILALAKSKINNIEALVSQALIDLEISHEEFITILEQKEKYEKMKENVKNVSEKNWKYKIKQCKFKILKNTRFWMIYVNSDFNWLEDA